jgi:hypothetical protein
MPPLLQRVAWACADKLWAPGAPTGLPASQPASKQPSKQAQSMRVAETTPIGRVSLAGAQADEGSQQGARCGYCVAGLIAVEAILGCRTTHGQREYYVKFKDASYRCARV